MILSDTGFSGAKIFFLREISPVLGRKSELNVFKNTGFRSIKKLSGASGNVCSPDWFDFVSKQRSSAQKSFGLEPDESGRAGTTGFHAGSKSFCGLRSRFRRKAETFCRQLKRFCRNHKIYCRQPKVFWPH